jgi:outer membrane receptor protein involved in Fe transport
VKKSVGFSQCSLACSSVGAILLFVSVSMPAPAQAVYGSILGSVISSSGQPISGALITVISEEKGSAERATSNSSGLFTITHLQSDTYKIRAEAPGCKAGEVAGEEVYADQAVTLEFHLEKGTGTGNAKTAEASSLLKTDRADVSTTLSAQDIRDLPNATRNFTAFELLAPGALTFPTADNTARPNQNPQQGLQIDQNGQHYGGSAFQLDGTDNRDPIAGLIVINPPLESLSEIKITAQNFDAEFGQALAGLVTAQTRSGSNTWHGSLFEFRNTNWGDASPPKLQNSNVTENPFKVNQFGGSLGGPVVANRLFIFGDYQGNRRALDFTKFGNVPTARVRTTCFTPGQDCDLSDYKKTLKCPNQITCAQPITGMTIPQADLSPQAVALLQLLPAPNVPNPGTTVLTFQNYEASGAEPWNDDEFDIRVDQNLSAKLRLFGRYSFFDSRLDAEGVFGNLLGGTGLSGDNFAGSSRSRDHSVSAGFDYLLSPSLTTDFRFGFYRYHVNVLQGGLNTTPASAAGIIGLNLGDSYSSGMPGIQIQQPTQAVTSNINFGYSQPVNNCNCPLLENEQQFQWANNWTKIHGNHTFKWGADFRYAQNLRITSDRHRGGDLTFSQQTAGLGLASFLLGYASTFDRYHDPLNDFSAGERQHRFFFYGQDTWRLNSRFTLTYGLRWEIYLPQSVTGAGQGGFLDVNTGMINVAGEGSTNVHGNVRNNFTNFAPRLGLAYHALKHTVLRAAYGRSFDLGSLGAVFGNSVTQNPPVLEFQQFLPQFPGQVVYDLRQPAPIIAVPPIVSGQIELAGVNNVAANVLPARVRVPTIDAWNVSVQHEINSSTSLELAYVANKSTHIFPEESSNALKNASYNLNQATIQGFEDTTDPSKCQPGSGSGTPASPCVSLLSSRQPYYSRFGWTQGINYFGNNASSNYESLQVKLDKRFTHGLEFHAAYAWSKGLGYVEDYFDINPRVNYGPNDFDRTHAFTLSTLWDLPIGRGRPILANTGGFLNHLVGGWALNTISYVYSGLPFSPTYNSSECAADVDTGPCRPNLVGPVHITGNRNDYFTSVTGSCFDSPINSFSAPGPACGPWQRPARGTFGTASRNSLRGPGFFESDLALLKNVTLTERFVTQFRAEVTNLFNKVNLGLPNGCVDCVSTTSGVIANLARNATMRQFRFALKLQF